MTALLLQWLVTGSVVAAVAALAVRLVPAGAAAYRHLLWWVALVAVLALPFMPLFTLVPALPSAPVASVPDAAPSALVTLVELPPWVGGVALALWGLAVVAAGVRLGLGVVTLRRLAATAALAESGQLPATVRSLRLARGARVWLSPDVRGACAIGFLRPRILVSTTLVAQLQPEQLEAIVLHEQAHLERWDDWTRLAQRIILAIAGLHPAVRYINRQIDLECEVACDQRVVARTSAPLAYAGSLALAAQVASAQAGVSSVLAPGASVSGGGLHQRVSRLLRSGPVRPWTRRAGAAAGLGLVGVASQLAVVMPPLVAFAALEPMRVSLASVPLRPQFVAARPHSGPKPFEVAEDVRRAGPAQVPVTVSSVAGAAAVAEPGPAAVPDVVADQRPVTVADTLDPRPLVPLALDATGVVPVSPRSGGIGASAARAGSATASVAARAGHSLGRFFRSGGRAVSDGF